MVALESTKSKDFWTHSGVPSSKNEELITFAVIKIDSYIVWTSHVFVSTVISEMTKTKFRDLQNQKPSFAALWCLGFMTDGVTLRIKILPYGSKPWKYSGMCMERLKLYCSLRPHQNLSENGFCQRSSLRHELGPHILAFERSLENYKGHDIDQPKRARLR